MEHSIEWWEIGIIAIVYLVVLMVILVGHSNANYYPEDEDEE